MNEQLKTALLKHVKIIGYLSVSGLLAWVIAEFSGDPRFIYGAPVINYILYAIEKELKDEGVVKTLVK